MARGTTARGIRGKRDRTPAAVGGIVECTVAPTATAGQVRIDWTEDLENYPTTDSFDLEYREGTTGPWTLDAGVTSPQTESGFTPGATVQARVRRNIAGWVEIWGPIGQGTAGT